MEILSRVKAVVQQVIQDSYPASLVENSVLLQDTKPGFAGDFTLVLFPFLKPLKKSPESLGNEWGQVLLNTNPGFFSSFNVLKGFLNLTVSDKVWMEFLDQEHANDRFGYQKKSGRKVMVEYSSPNTNKPLHFGHLRNNFLGWSVAEIYKAAGYQTIKTCIANDRGIHICKSMIAWQLFGHGATPESTGIKGDHFVGDYYVLFGTEFNKQVDKLISEGLSKEEADKEAPIMKAAQQMLIDWEAGRPDVISLWKTMNSWVYDGFEVTYRRIGSDFDKTYYESDTYILGKNLVEDGIKKAVFFKKDDGSVWIDLTTEGLDEKIVQRKDGTAVYITQDIGLIINKYEEYKSDLSIYVVGDEQNYHFKVLKLIAQKMGLPSANSIFHLSYGMVELPGGRMKTREGNVVDADDILDEMIKEAETKTKEQGKTEGFTEEELRALYEIIGLGGLKFFLLRVDPKKRMLFNPEESIDLHGYTATFIQYAYARIKSILRKESSTDKIPPAESEPGLLPQEKAVIRHLERFPFTIEQASTEMNPSLIANYAYNLAKSFNSFYAEHSIVHAENQDKRELRLQLARLTASVLKNSLGLLGIRVPERM